MTALGVPGLDGDVLAIDFGTTGTAAAVRRAGRVDPVSFGDRNWLPSCVFRRPDDVLVAGTEADRSAVLDPLSFEPTPKRRVGAGSIRLGGQDYRDADLVTAVFTAVLDEVHRQYPGINRARLVLTHPAVWGTQRRTVLAEAAARVGLPQPQFVAEPVAAAAYYAAKDQPCTEPVCVYDLGGVDFDRLLLEHVGTSCTTETRTAGTGSLNPSTTAPAKTAEPWNGKSKQPKNICRRIPSSKCSSVRSTSASRSPGTS